MLSSYPVACPHASCGWVGNLVPSLLRGGPDAEIVSMHRAWFRCPRCQGDWEVRITNDRVTVLPAVERGITFREGMSSKPSRAVAFDVDAASLISLREALPGWEIDTINGATPASLVHNWDPGAVDLLIASASGDVKEILGLCRFLPFCTWYSTDSREEVAADLDPRENLPALLPDAPVLVLVPAGRGPVVGAALEAGARSCLVLPIHPNELASVLALARAGNQLGRQTLSFDQAQLEDR
jgi:DNA-binding NarL/FixJ family response regulator